MKRNKYLMMTLGFGMILMAGCSAKSSEDELEDTFLQSTQNQSAESEAEERKTEETKAANTAVSESVSTEISTEGTAVTEDADINEDAQGKASETSSGDSENAQNPKSDSAAGKAAYISVLEDICRDHVFPDGSDFNFDASISDGGNQFAIYDIDFDGKDELIIQYTTTATAGMAEIIYDYDSKADMVKEEFVEFPLLTYYDNGIVEAGWSHNQGLAGLGGFWPYTLYRYESETDTYVMIAFVDAWNKEQADEDYEGNPFPEELDIDGDGFIYFVTAEGTYDENTIVDTEEYHYWRSSLIGGAKQVEVPYKALNEENVGSLEP